MPTREHARVGCRLLEAGIDVLVEKPMAASLAEADALIAAAERDGRILQVGHLERFNPGDRRRDSRSSRGRCFLKFTAWAFSRRGAWMLTWSTT